MGALRTFVTILALTLATAPAHAQFAYAELAGAVTSAAGPVEGVAVTARDIATGYLRTSTTTPSGTYAIAGLRPGTYVVTFERAGFTTTHHQDVELRLGQTTQLAATLAPASISETVTVTADRQMVDMTSKQVGDTLTADEFRDLPTQNRSFVLFAGLVPGVIPKPQTDSSSSDALFINGQHQANNSFLVDGAKNDDPTVGSQAGAQVRTAIEAIQEFQVLTSQFDAEFGGATGGVLNAITKSGTNSVKGSAFAFFQDAERNAKDFFARRDDLPRAEASFTSAGFTLGGPFVRDRLHSFMSFEWTHDREGHTRFFTSRPDLSYSTTENSEIRNVLVRADYHVTQSNHSSLRYLAEVAPQLNKIVGTRVGLEGAREEHDSDMNAIAGLESVFGDALFNSLRVSYNQEQFVNAASPFGEWASDFDRLRRLSPLLTRPSVEEGPSTVGQDQENGSIDLADTASWLVRQHELRAGAQWSRRAIRLTDFGGANGRFDFDTDKPFDPSSIATFPVSFNLRVHGAASSEIRNIDTLGLFVLDDWHLTSHLTLSAGVRWDRDDAVADHDNFAPRLGFAWSPQRSSRTVIRGGAGRFYDQTRLGRWSQPVRDAVRLTNGIELRVPEAANRQFFFDLARANGITTLVQLRNFLVSRLEAQTGTQINVAPTVDYPGRVQPYVDTITLGAQREVSSDLAVGIDLVQSESKETLLLADLNPLSRSRGGRPNISILDGRPVTLGSISTLMNAGSGRYRAVQISARKRMSGRIGARIAYTYADSDGTYGNAGPFGFPNTAYFQTRSETGYNFDTGEIIGEPLRLNLDDPRNEQPVGWHRRHNLALAGVWLVPRTSLSFSWLYRYMSGDRFTMFTSARLDNDNRALAPAGTYDAATRSDIARDGVSFGGTMFGAENPDFSRLDLRLSLAIPLPYRGARLNLIGDVFNATDRTNFVNAGGTITTAAAFLTPTSTFSPRQFQLGARISF